MNDKICEAGEHARALRAALLGAMAYADLETGALLRALADNAAHIESHLVEIDAALVAAGRDDE